MRFLKALTIGMGVLIVVTTTVLVVVIVRRVSGPAAVPASFVAEMNEAAGTHIVGLAVAGNRLAVQLQGGGPDRVLFVDPQSGAVVGRIWLHDSGH